MGYAIHWSRKHTLILRTVFLAGVVRAPRLRGHLGLDRSRPGAHRGAAHKPCPPDAKERQDPLVPARPSRYRFQNRRELGKPGLFRNPVARRSRPKPAKASRK